MGQRVEIKQSPHEFLMDTQMTDRSVWLQREEKAVRREKAANCTNYKNSPEGLSGWNENDGEDMAGKPRTLCGESCGHTHWGTTVKCEKWRSMSLDIMLSQCLEPNELVRRWKLAIGSTTNFVRSPNRDNFSCLSCYHISYGSSHATLYMTRSFCPLFVVGTPA